MSMPFCHQMKTILLMLSAISPLPKPKESKLLRSKLKENIKFLVQDAKQQILKYYTSHSIIHIIVNNYKIDGINYSSLPDEIECHFISLDIRFICLPTDLILYYKILPVLQVPVFVILNQRYLDLPVNLIGT